MSLSAVLKKNGHKTELVMEPAVSKAVSGILRATPRIVIFSTLTATGDFEWALEVANGIKQKNKNILTVFGNLHPTLFPEESLSHPSVDIICRGEGEYALLELCSRLASERDYSDIPGLWVKGPEGIVKNPPGKLIENLDEFPFPDRDLYQKYGYFNNLDSIDVLAGRGCPFSCSYCMNPVMRNMFRDSGKFIRKHSPDYLIAELEQIKEKFRPKYFTFVDELFTINKEWLREFSGKYKTRIGLPFVCNITPDTADDEVIALLSQTGVFCVCMGIETGNDEIRRDLLNKPITNAQIERTADSLHVRGIKLLTSNVVGWPGETVENAFETVELNRKIKTDFIYATVFQPYPGLPLTEKLRAEGVLPVIPLKDFDTTFFKGSVLKQANIAQLVNLHKFFFWVFKFPRLKSIVRFLIKLPPNWLFEQLFIISYAWLALSCFRRHPLQLLAMGAGNTRIFFGDKGISR